MTRERNIVIARLASDGESVVLPINRGAEVMDVRLGMYVPQRR